MLTDGHAQVAVEGLEDDLDGIPGGRRARRVTGKAGQVRDRERPADKAQELHQGGQQPDGGGQGQHGGVGVGQGGRHQDHGRGEQDRAHGEPPPEQDQAAAAGGEPLQHLASRLPQDVGVVEAAGEQGVEAVVGDRQHQQQQAGQHLGGQRGPLLGRAWEPTRPAADQDRAATRPALSGSHRLGGPGWEGFLAHRGRRGRGPCTVEDSVAGWCACAFKGTGYEYPSG